MRTLRFLALDKLALLLSVQMEKKTCKRYLNRYVPFALRGEVRRHAHIHRVWNNARLTCDCHSQIPDTADITFYEGNHLDLVFLPMNGL